MEIFERLNAVNDIRIFPVTDPLFLSFGRVLKGYDFSALLGWMEKNTEIPASGNVYVPSIEEMEKFPVFQKVQNSLYGGMPVQFGYCNGRNSSYNGFEYHKGSEINVAVTDFCLSLGHIWEIRNNSYRVEDATVFFVPKGTAVEMYQTTLHLSPLKVRESGFKDIVILPKGTNTPLTERIPNDDPETELLLQKNKWIICHSEREVLVRQGAHIGLLGENKELKYE